MLAGWAAGSPAQVLLQVVPAVWSVVVWVAVFAALPVLRLSGSWSYSFLIYRNNDKISASSISGAALSAKWYSDTFILFIFFVLSVLSKCPL